MSIFDIVDYSTGFFEAACIFILFEAFLSRRRRISPVFYCAGAAALGILIDMSNHLFSTNMLNTTIVISVTLLFSFMYSGGIERRLIPSILSFIVTAAAEIAVLMCMSVFLDGDVVSIVNTGSLRVIGIALSKALGFVIIILIAKHERAENNIKDNSYWFLLMIVLLSVLVTMNILYSVLYSGAERRCVCKYIFARFAL